ncbi:MAG: hypothetical protein AB1777_00610 [Bacteroidota bacterium]
MQKVNKLGEVLGPVGSIAGYFITIVAITQLFTSYKAIIFILFGLFIGFTSYVAYVDFDSKRYRNAAKLFGIFTVGKWQTLDNTMGLRIKKSNRAWRTYSASNRSFDISESNFLIELVDSQGKSLADIERFSNIEEAKEAISFYSEQLGLPIIQ